MVFRCLEEEMKRLHEELGDDSYGAVGFSYDQGQGQQAYQRKDRREMWIPCIVAALSSLFLFLDVS